MQTIQNKDAFMQADVLRDARPEQLEQAAAFNHTELFCLNALSVGGEVFRAADIVWTRAGDSLESMIAFPHLSEKDASEQLDKIIQYYIHHPPHGVGCWSLDPTQPKDLGVRLLARGFQPGWLPCWMALELGALNLDHPVPKGLMVVPDNTTLIHKIKNLPYGDTEIAIFSHQPAESNASLQRFIALIGGKVVAYCSVLLARCALGAAGIYHVGVLPSFRNQGIGKAVVGAACLHARNKGYHYALLNGTGQRMYEQVGFKKVGYGLTWWLKKSQLLAHPPIKKEIMLAEAIGRGDVDYLDDLAAKLDSYDLKAPITNGMSLMQLAVHCLQPVSAGWLQSMGVPINVLEAWDLGWKDLAAAILAGRQISNLVSGI
ncbi:MAG: GNAT family N-acetyltransferase [Chitinophagaceae bacterium]